ncbi:hypothetical protein [Williamwhitmania taraxaci]|uniref:Uncharacterized protein n=1 Tax=Williamwhitmania taraxaci TaxID=1640674 RepID=A0A1G6KK14_9BACT|nr:hypothetical protein [Williamwhitmania taraxaci]SDC31429.1 hypothetical protein SAMN05216323_102537 [Williamwhitmania taraxaci]
MLKKIKRYFLLKRLGFLGDQLGIAHRYHAEGSGWSNHLNKTGEAITSCLKGKDNCTIVIVGSGWLLDIPLKKILSLTHHVYLVDINHPKSIKHKWEANPKITFIETDVTGGAVSLFSSILKGEISEVEALEACKTLGAGLNIPKADVTISVNILSQLAHIPAETLKEQNKLSPETAARIITTLQLQHLDWLYGMESLLISDFEEELVDEENRLCGVNPLCPIDSKKWRQVDRWRWKFDTKMTYRSDFKTFLHVGVFHRIDPNKKG